MKGFLINRFIISVLIFSCLFLTGFTNFGKPPGRIFFSAEPIMQESIGASTDTFMARQRIYYAVQVPKGFQDDFIRIQIIKKDETSEFWGYKIYYCKDVEVQPGKKTYHDYLNIGEKGVYVMQVLEAKNIDKPIARGIFGVIE